MQISGISTLVTGGASGLGLGTARELVARGAKVVLLDLPSSPGEDAAKELGDAATFVAADVTDAAGVEAALDAAEADEVTSPTFTLIHEYAGTQIGKPVKLFHLDVYRLEGERQLETLGLDELLTPDALVLVEWGEKFKSIRKKSTGEIAITSAGGDARKITVTLKDQA